MEFTGERFLSSISNPVISHEHWHRYLYALGFTAGKTVLDLACGEGYGSFLLAQHARKVVGVDISSEAVCYAAERYKRENLEYITGPASAIPVKGQAVFDIIVSFETIEHLYGREQEFFLKEVKRLLKPEGLFMVSTPNKLTFSDIPQHKNEFHLKEFYVDEFKAFLEGSFKNVGLMGQKIYPVSYIWPVSGNSGNRKDPGFSEYGLEYSKDGFRPSSGPKTAIYVIALCSDAEITQGCNSALLDLSESMFRQREEAFNRINDLASALKAREAYIARLEAAVSELKSAVIMKEEAIEKISGLLHKFAVKHTDNPQPDS